jgi:hypothetical protein
MNLRGNLNVAEAYRTVGSADLRRRGEMAVRHPGTG